jgi:cell division protein FtsB
MSTDDHRAYVDARITELRDTLLAQVRDLADRIASLRDELRELRLRNERLESEARRF